MFFTTKKVKKGEELFFDYGNDYYLEWKDQFDKLMSKYIKEDNVRKR